VSDPRLREFRVALVVSLVLHVVAVLSMLTVLAPGVDMKASASSRAAFVRENPVRWRLGWTPWQATAASDVILSLALLRLALARKRAVGLAWLGLASTALAVFPDQWGELSIDTELVRAASGTVDVFVGAERRGLTLTGTCGAAGYTLMFLFWIATGARLATVRKWLALYGAAGLVSAVAFAAGVWANERSVSRAAEGYPGFDLVVLTNGIGFGLLVPWMALLGFVVRENP
jgi:hypothetical protein